MTVRMKGRAGAIAWEQARGRAAMLTLAGVVVIAFGGLTLPAAQDGDAYPSAGEWRQWGGPNRNFKVDVTGLASSWPAGGPPRLWSRVLGHGHSTVVVDDGRLFTLYRVAQQVAPLRWPDAETVIALDATTGQTLWEHTYPSEPLNFRNGAGPHASPLVVGEILFTVGTNKQLLAFDKRTGDVRWSHDLVAEYGAPPTLIRPAVKAGYASSPTAYKDTVIVTAGGAGQSVMAFSQTDGSLAWKSGDFLISPSTPLLIDVDGQVQLVVYGGQTVNGLDPDTGALLWTVEHETTGDMNTTTPIWGDDNVLLVTSAYDGGTRALRLSRDGAVTTVEELWYSRQLRVMFANALRLGDYVYGTSGDFGPVFLTALNVHTGEEMWQVRGFGRASLLYADNKAVIIDEDGSLVLATLSPDGVEVLSRTSLFETTSWTAPSLVGSTLFVRDRARIMALDLGAS